MRWPPWLTQNLPFEDIHRRWGGALHRCPVSSQVGSLLRFGSMTFPHSPALVLANLSAIAALLVMMLGVGMAIGSGLRLLPRRLDGRTALLQLAANLVVVPTACAVYLAVARPSAAITIALLLLACFPAGPISLIFVRQQDDALARSTAIVLLLQAASVVISPLLLLFLGELILGRPIVAAPRAAAISMASQMLLLEISPIVLGALWGAKLGKHRERVRAGLRRLAMLFLAVAGLAFGSLYLEAFLAGFADAARAMVVLLVVSWGAAALFRGSAGAHDAAQVTGLRNISLSIVVAGTTPGLADSVVFVLCGAGIVTLGAPLLRLTRRLRGLEPPEPGPAESADA